MSIFNITKNHNYTKDEQFFKEKVITLNIIMIIMGIITFFFSVLRFFQGNHIQGFIDFGLFLSIVAGYYILYKNKQRLMILSRILIIFSSITSVSVIVLLPEVDTRFSWVIICVYMMFFLLDLKEGIKWVVSLLAIIVLLYFGNIIDITLPEFLIFIISTSLLALLLSRYERIKKTSEKHFVNYNKELQKAVDLKTKELNILNSNLEKIVTQEVEKNRQKDLQVLESAKMASLGEMIGNIAHQWRQPLSAISMIASNIQVQKQINTLSFDEIDTKMSDIIEKTKYLSQTIDTFRDFIKEKKELKTVILQDRIDIALNVVGVVLMDKNIKLHNNINYLEPIEITLFIGELEQVLINIINNAKDALIENKINNPYVSINMEKKEKMIQIDILDNGGGIPDHIITKIFDPYFTTKHQSQGTGLGLHMSYKIITESFKGKLKVRNSNDGAKFTIELPIKES